MFEVLYVQWEELPCYVMYAGRLGQGARVPLYVGEWLWACLDAKKISKMDTVAFSLLFGN
jgi:hypothetical protein